MWQALIKSYTTNINNYISYFSTFKIRHCISVCLLESFKGKLMLTLFVRTINIISISSRNYKLRFVKLVLTLKGAWFNWKITVVLMKITLRSFDKWQLSQRSRAKTRWNCLYVIFLSTRLNTTVLLCLF